MIRSACLRVGEAELGQNILLTRLVDLSTLPRIDRIIAGRAEKIVLDQGHDGGVVGGNP